MSNVQQNAPTVELNTLVVAVDFGKEFPPHSIPILQLISNITLANEIDRYNFHRYAYFNPLAL